jgi:hypothetical protein
VLCPDPVRAKAYLAALSNDTSPHGCLPTPSPGPATACTLHYTVSSDTSGASSTLPAWITEALNLG